MQVNMHGSIEMAKSLREWVKTDTLAGRNMSLRQLSEQHFFRDPVRGPYNCSDTFFSPADGVILYQKIVSPGDPVLEVKGRSYTVREILRDDDFAETALVVGIFMTAYDVHINRVPYSGLLNWRELPPMRSANLPMLAVEEGLLRRGRIAVDEADYLFANQRMLNRVTVAALGLTYYMVQIADCDVATITPFQLGQNTKVFQGQRFSQIRFGSQVELVVPIRPGMSFELLQQTTDHVEAGLDPLFRIRTAATVSVKQG